MHKSGENELNMLISFLGDFFVLTSFEGRVIPHLEFITVLCRASLEKKKS